jgi:alpha-L-fucosidase 2
MTSSRRLWYRQPALEWEQALPLGNGRLGALVYGGVRQEQIKLNEDTLWSGGPRDAVVPDGGRTLTEIRRLILEEDDLPAA